MPTISHYEILEKLGEGGMGVVWKARDTRLERFVAIKVLPAAKTADPARRLRFIQEARAASALNHPRIITIYEIDRSDGPDGADFIAMEFVPGRTLDQLVPAKGLRIGEVLKYAIQIADALAAAHGAGIVHRDLKPANVMVTEKGDVKVLDFGLAKLMENPTITEADRTRTVVTNLPHTEEGTILGTASYMSPEQAEGKKVDVRSDVFSFGVLLYEMLTGHRAFQGESKIATLAAILNLEPEPLEKQNPSLPRELVRLVQRCLRKDPDRRAHSMQDLKLALEELKEDSDSGRITTHSEAQSVLPRQRSRQLILGAALAGFVAAGTAAFWFGHGPAKTETLLQAVPLTTFPGYESSPSFSPDGSQLTFSWNGEQGDNYDIYVQLVGSGRPLRLTTDPARDFYPRWSRDGRSIAFARLNAANDVSIMVIPALGGVEREVAQLGSGYSTQILYSACIISDWSPDGRWLVVSKKPGNEPFGLFLLSVETGETRRITTAPAGITGDFGGMISPDGRTLAFVRMLKGLGAFDFISDVFTVPLTADLKLGGEATRMTSDSTTVNGIAWMAGGEIVFSSNRSGRLGLWKMGTSRSDKPQRVLVGEGASSLAMSTNANRLVYEQPVSRDTNIWRMDLSAEATPPVSFIASTRQEESPVYSPDGKRIAFRSDRSGTLQIWVCNADGSNQVQVSTRPTAGSPHWSPDSSQITFDATVDGRWQIFAVQAQGGQARQITTKGGTRPSWSHDGHWIYFVLSQAGRSEVWKTAVSGGDPVQVSKNGGTNPLVSDDGESLYYGDGPKIMKSALDGSSETSIVTDANADGIFNLTHDGIYYSAPRPSLDLRFFNFATGTSRVIFKRGAPGGSGVTVSPDGHWLLYTQIDGTRGSDLMLVENFR
jgi:serine/threonine protein kinase